MNFFKKIKSLNIFLFLNYFFGFIYTKLFYKNARLIRLPFYLRNEGKFSYGTGLSLGPNSLIEIFGRNSILKIGSNFSSYYNLHIGCNYKITIGNNVLVASNVYISDHQHGYYKNINLDSISNPNTEPQNRKIFSESILIGDNVWIGEGVKILPGVKIGNGSILGAGSVISKDIPKNSICVGVPAKPIKIFNEKNNAWINL